MTRKEIRIKDDDIVFCGDSLDNKCNIVNELKQEIERLKKENELNKYTPALIIKKLKKENEEYKKLLEWRRYVETNEQRRMV